jgi:hypothetical protein
VGCQHLLRGAFVPAIAAVIIVCFTSVSREQARSAAELNAAREIQQRLVPVALPQFANCRIEVAYLPAQEVGGDFYQVIDQHDGSILIVVGDVSGKGLRAAMTGASAIGALQAITATTTSPVVLLEALNRQIHSTGDSGFITCLCAALTEEGVLILANAGHLAPYLNGREVSLESGLPVTRNVASRIIGESRHVDDIVGLIEAQAGSTLRGLFGKLTTIPRRKGSSLSKHWLYRQQKTAQIQSIWAVNLQTALELEGCLELDDTGRRITTESIPENARRRADRAIAQSKERATDITHRVREVRMVERIKKLGSNRKFR